MTPAVVLLAGLALLPLEARPAEWRRQEGAALFLRIPDSKIFETGFGAEGLFGTGTERLGILLAWGMSWQNTDDEAVLDRVRPLVPTSPTLDEFLPMRLELGPSLRLSHPVGGGAFGLELGIRGVWQPGPRIEWVEPLTIRRYSMPRFEDVEFDIGIVGRIGAHVEFGAEDARLFVGVAYETDLNGAEAKFRGARLEENIFRGFQIRFGVLL